MKTTKTKTEPVNPKKLRESLGLSLTQLAAKAGISRSTILRVEKKKRFSSIRSIAAAHRLALGIPL